MLEPDNEMYAVVEREGFTVDNDLKAEWVLKKIADAEKEYKRLEHTCQSQISFYTYCMKEAEEKFKREREYFISLLAAYFPKTGAKKTKTQATYQLPSGKLVYKFDKPVMKPVEDKLIESLIGTEHVEMVPKLKWGEYKKTLKIVGDAVVDQRGEVVEGVTVEVTPSAFDVEVYE